LDLAARGLTTEGRNTGLRDMDLESTSADSDRHFQRHRFLRRSMPPVLLASLRENASLSSPAEEDTF